MTNDEIFAGLQRLKSLPRLADVASETGLHRCFIWQLRRGRFRLTPQTASKLASVLTRCEAEIRATFGVSGRR
jgi:hypothetical protein